MEIGNRCRGGGREIPRAVAVCLIQQLVFFVGLFFVVVFVLFLLFTGVSFFFNWGIVVLQCCVSFYCTAKWSSLCYTAGSH